MRIEFYTKADGSSPLAEFIDNLAAKDQVRVYHTFELVEKYGLETNYFKPFAGIKRLWELKVSIKDGALRFFLTYQNNRVVLLLHVFQKKSQKTPLSEINLAQSRLNEFKGER